MKIKIYAAKKIVVLVLVVAFQQVLTSMTGSKLIKLSGSHEGSTGAPNEKTCAQSGCHSDAAVDPGTLVNTLIFNNGDSVYVPGETYTVKIRISKAGIKRFGFQVTSLNATDNSFAGTLVVTDGNRTQLQNGIPPNTTRKYITHKTNGAAPVSAGVGEWTFNWKAPATNVGPIKFYYATNATNMNNQNTGDHIYLSSFQIKPKAPNGIIEKADKEEYFHAHYVSSNRQLLVSYDRVPVENAKIEIRDMQGKLLQSAALHSEPAPVKNRAIQLNSNMAAGVYLVTYRVDNTMLSRKVFIGR